VKIVITAEWLDALYNPTLVITPGCIGSTRTRM
jgi:hypothetical protein